VANARLVAELPPPADGPVELAAVSAVWSTTRRHSLDGASFACREGQGGADRPRGRRQHELAMVLGGIVRADRGRVCLDGQDVAALPIRWLPAGSAMSAR